MRDYNEIIEQVKTNNPDTTYLYLEDRELIALAEVLKTNKTVTSLNLSNQQYSNEGVIALVEILKTNNTITSLDLINANICDKKVIALAEALKINSTLTFLDFSQNEIGNEGAVALAETLKTNPILTRLNLYHTNIYNEGAIALAEALKINSTLTDLTLNGNNIGNEAAIALAEALKINSTLTFLNLHNNNISGEGDIALTEAFNTSETIDALILNGSYLSKTKAASTIVSSDSSDYDPNEAKIDYIDRVENSLPENYDASNPNITNLMFDSFNADELTIALAEALEENKTGIGLFLTDLNISNEEAIALAEILKTNQSVTSLDLASNNISDEGAIALAEALKINEALIHLDLQNNNINEEGIMALIYVFKENYLININLGDNNKDVPLNLIQPAEADYKKKDDSESEKLLLIKSIILSKEEEATGRGVIRTLRILQGNCNINTPYYGNVTPLMLASKAGKYFLIQLLLDAKAEIDVISNNKQTALGYASQALQDKCVEKLIQHGANVDNAVKGDIFCDFTLASLKSKIWAWKIYNDTDRNIIDLFYSISNITYLTSTPDNFQKNMVKILDLISESDLFSAKKSSDLIKHIINLGVDIVEDFTPLKRAIEYRNAKTVEALLQCGASLTKKTYGRNAHDLAKNAVESARASSEPEKIFPAEEVLELIEQKTIDRALVAAVKEQNVSLVEKALNNGADFNFYNKRGDRTILFLAAKLGNPEIIEMLLDRGANVHVTDNHGKQALDYLDENNKENETLAKKLQYEALTIENLNIHTQAYQYNKTTSWQNSSSSRASSNFSSSRASYNSSDSMEI